MQRKRGDVPWRGSIRSEFRWQLEAARLITDSVWWGRGVPRGDGQAVLLVPGFLIGDWSLSAMYLWLRRIGYHPHHAGMVFNVDCSARALDALQGRVEALAERSGGRVSIVGHSRGGILGRALATRTPDLLKHVITLGSGLLNGYDVSPSLQAALWLVRGYHQRTTDRVARHGCMTEGCSCSFGIASRAPFPESVDLVSIYSREDGLSHWRSSRVPYGRNVEVTGSHLGLAVNRDVYRTIALALAGQRDEVHR
jgi:pimeloyl-ACP methyl ester carboxylesterase